MTISAPTRAWRRWRTTPTRSRAGKPAKPSRARSCWAKATRQSPALTTALGRELDRAQEDPAFAALALRLPDLNELILAAHNPDPEALFEAREDLRRAIADGAARTA